jgi:TolB-like protein
VSLERGKRLGSYEILALLGTGGMGSVWKACDHRLGREVAIKVLSREWAGAEGLPQLQREARMLAAVGHPNVCQIFDFGEHEGAPYLAMEMLAGESLAARLARGPLPTAEAIDVTIQILSALGELHRRAIVHRDLKPSNVFLTPYGVKILDFGLAQQASGQSAAAASASTSGTVYGTPRYMAPEQWGGAVGPAADLFACGALLYEMLVGKPALAGETAPEILRALHAGPPSLSGGRGIEALTRVVRRAMAVRPEERFASAAEMSKALEALATTRSGGVRVDRTPLTRLLVLPFRLLRSDPAIDFLSTGLADAVTASLGDRPDLVVHSSRMGARFADEDPARIAGEAGVDAVLCGTLLRAGERVRVATQLLEVPSGTVLSSSSAEASLADLFALQDDLARQVAQALHVSLARQGELRRHDPDPKAFEAYLRGVAIEINTASARSLRAARDHFREAVKLDADLAPAWARLGRVHRIMAKYGHGDGAANRRLAQRAFDTALALDPELSLAHTYYAQFEIEELGNPVQALLRLVARVESAPADPDLFAGLVVACRYTGLLDASLAAHATAVRLDPEMRTSVQYTYWALGEYERVRAYDTDPTRFLSFCALGMIGREDEALAAHEAFKRGLEGGLEVPLGDATAAALRGDLDACRAAAQTLQLSSFRDPEGILFVARALARAGDADLALAMLERVVTGGFTIPLALTRDPWLETVRPLPRFAALLEQAVAAHRHAADVFAHAEGPRRLGLHEQPTGPLGAARPAPPSAGGDRG